MPLELRTSACYFIIQHTRRWLDTVRVLALQLPITNCWIQVTKTERPNRAMKSEREKNEIYR